MLESKLYISSAIRHIIGEQLCICNLSFTLFNIFASSVKRQLKAVCTKINDLGLVIKLYVITFTQLRITSFYVG